MSKPFHRIISSLFLLALVFAMSGKTAHVVFEHHDEEACTERTIHFHEAEHSCFICEFDFQLSDGIHFTQPGLKIISFETEPVIAATVFVFSTSFFDFATRGPPVA
ncbi:MAG TPA: hypothetical protein VK177_19260 [Flavobacteriales bacterium]|nr:hypothetical protein [Flavobacteriales bacterium]